MDLALGTGHRRMEDKRGADAAQIQPQGAAMEEGEQSNPLSVLNLCGAAHLVFPKSIHSYYFSIKTKDKQRRVLLGTEI